MSQSISDQPFKYIAGNPALDLVNTVDWTSQGPEQDRLGSYDRLTRWAEGAEVLPVRQAAALRRKAASKPKEAEAALEAAKKLRRVLQRLFGAVAGDEPLGQPLDEFNQLLGEALEHMRVLPDRARISSRRVVLGWEELDRRLDGVLWPVLWSATTLLTSGEASLVRVCGGADCGWMYVDRSRNGLRRWCQMETCGTREKTRRRYIRR
jgi:predicted RNA-binding Zn ribbon-like protein